MSVMLYHVRVSKFTLTLLVSKLSNQIVPFLVKCFILPQVTYEKEGFNVALCHMSGK